MSRRAPLPPFDEKLLAERLRKGQYAKWKNGQCQTLLHWCVSGQMPKLLRHLDVDTRNLPTNDNNDGDDVDWARLESASLRAAKLLLEHGAASVDETDDQGRTPLHVASQLRRKTVIDFLLRHGANVNSQDGLGQTPLHKIFLNPMDEFSATLMVARLVREGAKLNTQDTRGQTPLHLLFTHSLGKPACGDLIRSLVTRGGGVAEASAIINQQDCEGQTLLHLFMNSLRSCTEALPDAQRHQLMGDMTLLLRLGADPNVLDSNGQTPLHKAAAQTSSNNRTLVQGLRSFPKSRSSLVHTKYKRKVINLLLRHGASATQKDNRGNNPLDLVCSECCLADRQLITTLMRHGCCELGRPTQKCRLVDCRYDAPARDVLTLMLWQPKKKKKSAVVRGLPLLHRVLRDVPKPLPLLQQRNLFADCAVTAAAADESSCNIPSPLHVACEFVSRNRLDVEYGNRRNPFLDLVKMLLRHFPGSLQQRDRQGRNPIHVFLQQEAFRWNTLKATHILEYLYQTAASSYYGKYHAAEPNPLVQIDSLGRTPLHTAIDHCWPPRKAIETLITKGPEALEMVDERRCTPFRLFYRQGVYNDEHALVEVGRLFCRSMAADAFTEKDPSTGRTVLYEALTRRLPALAIRDLVGKGPANALRMADNSGMPPLVFAVATDNLTAVQELLRTEIEPALDLVLHYVQSEVKDLVDGSSA